PDLQAAVLLLPRIPTASEQATDGAGIDLGWLSLVPKPFTAAQLTRAVTTAIGEQPVREETARTAYDVLIVDDDPDSRRVASKFLIDSRARIREAMDGDTALTEMRRLPPDVLVL